MPDFLEKITDSIDKGIKSISARSKEFLETRKLKGDIKDLEASIQSKFQQLGRKIFEMINKGTLKEDELKTECDEIKSLFKKITEREEAIRKIEAESLKTRYGAEIICPKCGTPNKADAKFCVHCGSTITGPAPVTPAGGTCPACGTPVKGDAKFCMRCGSKII